MNPNRRLRKIILVEDDPFDAEMFRAVMDKEFSADVQLACTKAAFEAALKSQPPELIVSDSNVKSFDGLAALGIAADRCPDVPFIFCSGSEDPARRDEAFAKGATAWTTKDDSFSQLVEAIKRILSPRTDKR